MAMKKFLLIFLALPVLAFATNRTPEAEAEAEAAAHAKAQAQQQQQQQQVAEGGAATASNEGVNVGGDSSNVENNSSTVVLVPNNNTENCLRIWGIAFGNSNGSGGLGYPHRSAACDYEQAADDAGAVGDHNLAWYWRCHKKNVYKPFKVKVKGQSRQERNANAVEACHRKMVQFLDSGTAAERIKQLTEQRDTLLKERAYDQQRCNESKDRILEGCRK